MHRNLSESDICLKYITPALEKAGWDVPSPIFQETRLNQLTNGRGWVRGQLSQQGKPPEPSRSSGAYTVQAG